MPHVRLKTKGTGEEGRGVRGARPMREEMQELQAEPRQAG